MPEQELTSGFMVIHGNQPELLRQLLVHWFREYPLGPLEDETILVQSNGIAQWIKLALAADADGGGCGIAASLDMLLPSRFVWQAYRAVLGQDSVPDASPFDKSFLVWRLMRLLPDLAGRAGYEPLTRFLEADGDLRKRYQLADRIADLFDQYQVYRADWLDAWAQGRNVLTDARGAMQPIEEAELWQPMLWRALLDDVGPAAPSGRAAVHQRFLAATAELRERPPRLPRRVSVFGLSSLPRQSLEVLLAISRFSQVILCVHNPCGHYWSDLLSERDRLRRRSGRHARKAGMPETIEAEALHLHAHPLLASWGKQGRDYIALLDELDEPEKYRGQFERMGERIDLFQSPGESCLLNQLQDDILQLKPLQETLAAWPAVDPARDRSIRFHVAHSPQREVEILHDQLLAAFDADPTLRPRDVIVMVPDIDKYAPHIEAVFGQIDRSDERYMPFSIADQAKRHQAPLAFALEFLLGAPESRLGVGDLLDLLDVPAVRQRFGIDADDLPLLHRWIDQTHIRWGLNARHRERFVGPSQEQNTWIHGLKQMLLGYAVGGDPTGREDRSWQGIEPYSEVSGLEAALAGPLARLLMQLETLADTLATPMPAAEWNERLQALLRDFFQSGSAEDSLLLLHLQSTLQTWAEACRAVGLTEAIPLAVVREHWLAQIDQGSLGQRFMAGRLTFATLMPMRAIPFRMLCLLGMNDGEFPRSRPPVDFDLMARAVRPGDRSRREDDRYLFLEALLSAREKLHISWVGRSIHDNSGRPPSVLVSQLRDHIAAGWRRGKSSSPGGEELLMALTVEHPLQAFSREYLGNDPASSPLFTYAREWERGEAADSAGRGPEQALPPPVIDAPLALGQLAGFLKDPVRAFFRERLGVRYETEDASGEDHEPFALDGLTQWALQDQLIHARLDALLHGQPGEDAVERQMARIRRRGELPFGALAGLTEKTLAEPLDAMFALYGEARTGWPEPLDDQPIDAVLHTAGGHAIAVQGLLTQRYGSGSGRCRIEISSSNLLDGQKYRRDRLFAAWVMHLAGHLDGRPMTTLLIGKNGLARIAPLDADEARRHLAKIAEAYVDGLRSPLQLSPRTGFAWLERGGIPATGPLAECRQEAVVAARRAYEGDDYANAGELGHNPYLQRAYPSFGHLWSNGRFAELCSDLLGPLMHYVKSSEDTSKGERQP